MYLSPKVQTKPHRLDVGRAAWSTYTRAQIDETGHSGVPALAHAHCQRTVGLLSLHLAASTPEGPVMGFAAAAIVVIRSIRAAVGDEG